MTVAGAASSTSNLVAGVSDLTGRLSIPLEFFVAAIRESQPSEKLIREYFEHPVNRFLGPERSLEEWLDFGMEQQKLHGHPFVWICNTNRGVAKVSRAALRNLGIGMEEVEDTGYLGDPNVKGSMRIVPREGVWLRLTRNLDKARGFVNGAIGQVHEVFRFPDIFSVLLTSGTLVMVHPVSYGATARRRSCPACTGTL